MPEGTPRPRRLKFGDNQRIKRGWEFERTRNEGKRLVKGCLILNWRIDPGQEICRLGVITSKKIGNAVARARARRLLREVFRSHQHRLSPQADLILIARHSIRAKKGQDVERDFLSAAKQAGLLQESK